MLVSSSIIMVDLDLSDSNVLNQDEERPNTVAHDDSRDSSTMRLRQMIGFRQQNKPMDEKEDKMVQKLKPYLNKFRFSIEKPVNKVMIIRDFSRSQLLQV